MNTLYKLLIDSYIYIAISVVSLGEVGQGERAGCQSRGGWKAWHWRSQHHHHHPASHKDMRQPAVGNRNLLIWKWLGVLQGKRYFAVFVTGSHRLSLYLLFMETQKLRKAFTGKFKNCPTVT